MVQKISQNDKQVIVEGEIRDPKQNNNEKKVQVKAKFCVVAIPPTLAGRIQYEVKLKKKN